MVLPSGENVGSRSTPALRVSGRASPPVVGTDQRSPPQAKTRVCPSGLSVGWLARRITSRPGERVGSCAAAAAEVKSEATVRAVGIDERDGDDCSCGGTGGRPVGGPRSRERPGTDRGTPIRADPPPGLKGRARSERPSRSGEAPEPGTVRSRMRRPARLPTAIITRPASSPRGWQRREVGRRRRGTWRPPRG